MLSKVYTPLIVRILPRQAGKDAQRFFSEISGRKSSKAVLLGGRDESDNKWNKLNNKGRQRCMSNHTYFSENQSVSSIRKQLMNTFPIILQDLVEDPMYKDIPDIVSCFKDTLQRTIPTEKDNLTVSFMHCYMSMEDPRNITPENIKLASILGWCFQTMQASVGIMDDIIDEAEYRQGRKCWYKNEDVGSRALVDGVLVDIYMYQWLKKYFSHLPMYVPTVQLFQETCLKLGFSFHLDGVSLDANKDLPITRFTRKRFQTVTRYTPSSVTFELPYVLARHLSNTFQTEIPPQTREMLTKLGEFSQIQDDFRDCYDDVFANNKTTSDIEDGKGTWLITTALEKANPLQRRLLETYYGKKGPEAVNIVKDIYKALEIPKAYANYEKDAFSFIEKNIEQVSKLTCPELMFKPLDNLYQQYV